MESTRPAPTSPTSPRVRFTDNPPPSPGGSIRTTASGIPKSAMSQTQSQNHNGSPAGMGTVRSKPRVIRTFEEIDRIVPREEWYEELECGICSHVLGAPQGLVPCGHSFCGPCAWTWIKVNHNNTCPACRVPVNETIPLIPNIVVDQIIDRKLAGLPDGKEKEGHVMERESKAADWKVLQSSIVPPKPPPARRTGRAMGVLNNLFEPMPHHRPRRPNPERRSTFDDLFDTGDNEMIRQATGLEADADTNPGRRSVYAGLSLAEATRRNVEDDASARPQSAARRLGQQTGGLEIEQSLAGFTAGGVGPSRTRPGLPNRTSSSTTLEQHRMRSTTLTNYDNNNDNNNIGGSVRARPSLHLQVRTGSSSQVPMAEGSGGTGGVRRSITTSRALLNRQDRYRDRGSNRDNAVLVVSDSD